MQYAAIIIILLNIVAFVLMICKVNVLTRGINETNDMLDDLMNSKIECCNDGTNDFNHVCEDDMK